jgi:hypothetical protein
MNAKKSIKHLWMIEDVPATGAREAKSYWTRIGVAFENRDGSWTLEMSAIPMNGRLHMRDPQPREKDGSFVPDGASPTPAFGAAIAGAEA